jgi:hypothetical protein
LPAETDGIMARSHVVDPIDLREDVALRCASINWIVGNL